MPDVASKRRGQRGQRSASRRVSYTVGQRSSTASPTWFRGDNVNYLPMTANLDAPTAPMDFVLDGWLPEDNFITKSTSVTAFGSCFAANISNWLQKRHFNVLTKNTESKAYVVQFGEGMVNSFSILQQFQWAFEKKAPDQELWHGYKAESHGYNEEIRRETEKIFASTDVFIITFGLSEVWYDEPTGGVFWRAVPHNKFDPSRHKFRVSTIEENRSNMDQIYRIIKKHRPDSKIIFTLSPIPLFATFRPVSCISANSVSKATLRVAIDDVVTKYWGEDLYYWPSYEFVMEYFLKSWKRDGRHVKQEILDFIMLMFEKVYCAGASVDHELMGALLNARVADGSIPRPAIRALEDLNYEAIKAYLDRWEKRKSPERINLMLEYLRAQGEMKMYESFRKDYKSLLNTMIIKPAKAPRS